MGQHEQVSGLLAALERQVADADNLAAMALNGVRQERFAAYLGFRRQVDEMLSLASLLEGQLQRVQEERTAALRGEFDRLDLALTMMLVRTARDFFAELNRRNVLPLGAREIFLPDVGSLGAAREKVARLSAVHDAAQAIGQVLDAAEAELDRVLTRAPALPDFTKLPDARTDAADDMSHAVPP